MKLDAQFKEFLRQIRPTDPQQEAWRAAAKTLRDRLAADSDLKNVVVSTFLQGSIRRATAIRPLGEKRPDVDIVVVTNIDHEKVRPEDAMNLFVAFLDKHYKEKWRPQGRSFGITMSAVDMDLVITALPRPSGTIRGITEDASLTANSDIAAIYRSDAARSLDTLEDDMSWRLNAGWRQRNVFDELGRRDPMLTESVTQVLDDAPPQGWKDNPLWLPDRDTKTWGRTHPLLQISWTAEKNRRTNLTYLNVVRIIKWWRLEKAEKLPKYPKGYPLEHMVGYLLEDGSDLTTAQGVVQVFEAFRDRWLSRARARDVPALADHGVAEHNVLARLSPEDFEAFVEIVNGFAALAREALEAEDAAVSGALWRRILGIRFPLPPPRGGDRVPAQFAAPPAVTTAARSDRFA